MQPWFEKVTVADGQSWTLFDRQLPEFPFNWHYHPEFELTLTLNSVGERFIGDNVSHYGDGDLILVGPNLPHAWQSRSTLCADQPHRALVVWFSEGWAQGLTRQYAELATIDAMLARSARGLSFSDAIRDAVRPRLLALVDASPAARWLGLVDVLLTLASDASCKPLALRGFVPPESAHDRARLERVLTHLHKHYAEPVRLSALATRTNCPSYDIPLRIAQVGAVLYP